MIEGPDEIDEIHNEFAEEATLTENKLGDDLIDNDKMAEAFFQGFFKLYIKQIKKNNRTLQFRVNEILVSLKVLWS